jgi:hypothetical protein
MVKSQNLVRFDLLLPHAAIEVIKNRAATKGVSPRTMGRMLLIEKVKEIVGIASDDVLGGSA